VVTPVKFTHELRQTFQQITGEPGENRGVRRRELMQEYIVRASQGAVLLRVVIQLDTDVVVAQRGRYKAVEPRAVSSHFTHRINDWWIDSDKCDVLAQGHCYGDTGYMVAGEVWASFCEDEALGWKHLEDIYNEWRKKDG
jgi:hypothetical protein